MADTRSLYQFMTQLNKNSVRTQNLFEMRVFIPYDLTNNHYRGRYLTNYLNPNFTYYGQGFELPARTLQYADVGFKGYTVPVPTVMKMTQEHTVTINSDINGDMRRAFLTWQAFTMNGQINSAGGYFEGARRLKDSAKLYISLLDPTYDNPHQVIETYTIYGVTVEDVGTLTLSNVESGIATFQVKFRSQYWQYGIQSDSNNDRNNGALGSNTSERLQFTGIDGKLSSNTAGPERPANI